MANLNYVWGVQISYFHASLCSVTMRSAFTLLWSHIQYSWIHCFRITYNNVESEDSFHQHIGLEIKKETNEMLHWRIVVYGVENRSEIP
jgi:hypothetical protein